MKKNHLSMIALVAIMLLGAGCSKDNTLVEGESNGELKVMANIVSSDNFATRSVVTNFSKSTIGVYVDDAADVYSPAANSTASVSTGANSVAPSPSIYINAAATVYAWYPATADELTSPNSTSTKTIELVGADDFTATSQTDYLWATPASVSKNSCIAALTFKHALSKVVFSVKLGDKFEGDASLTEVSLTSSAATPFLTGNGTMGIADGAIKGLTGINALTYTGTSALDKTAAKEVTALVAPTTLTSDIVVKLTINGLTYLTTLPVVSVPAWDALTQYTYNVTVSSAELTIGAVTITDWTVGGSTDISVE